MRLENLTYEEYRSIAEDGDIIFLHGTKRSVISTLITFFTGSHYTHVAFAFWVTINKIPRLMVVESQGGTTRRILAASYYKDRILDIKRCPVPWSSICDRALSKVGTARYGYIDAFYVGLREYCWNHFKLRLPKCNQRGEICSEFIARLVELDPVSISPGELYEKLRVLFPPT